MADVTIPPPRRSAWMKWLKRLVVVAVLAAGAWYGWRRFGQTRAEAVEVRYRTAKVVRMDVMRNVEATGTVQPIKEVEVGAQVNGRIVKLLVDYNSVVTNGQVVALIDPQVYEANYKSALGELHSNEANVKKFEAQLVLAEKTLARKRNLAKKDMAPIADLDAAQEARDTASASLDSARAGVEKSQAAVSQAKANLDYCTIVSPVNGIVIDRSVDEGQTVVSSMNAVPLLKLATDLKRIQVEATVPEADIGGVRVGQHVTFTVDAYPGVKFSGEVTQVRMASTTTSSVVTYPVIIQADNPGDRLYPGMTANIAVHIAEAKGVAAVTAAAFRFRPPEPPPEGGMPAAGAKKETAVYVLEGGRPVRTVVKTGLSDGAFTEIKSPDGMDGKEVVLGVVNAMAPTSDGPSNPFMPKFGNRRKPSGPPPR